MRAPGEPADKDTLRAFFRAARSGLDPVAWSDGVVAALRAWDPYRRATTVATYLPFGDEADLTSLASDGIRFVAPRIAPGDRRLVLHELGGPLRRHRFGMDEPLADAPVVPAEEVDLVLVPGLAFDRSGTRLGYGGGYYDALLAKLAADVPRVGVAHAALLFDALPLEAHDVPMTHLALTDGVVACAGR